MSILTYERPNGDYVARLPAWTDRQRRLGLPVTVTWKCEYGEHSEADLVKVLAHAKKTGAKLGVSYDPDDKAAHTTGDPLDVNPQDDRDNIARIRHYVDTIGAEGVNVGSVFVDGALEHYEAKRGYFDQLLIHRIEQRYETLYRHARLFNRIGFNARVAMYGAWRRFPQVRTQNGLMKISAWGHTGVACGDVTVADFPYWYDAHVHAASLAANLRGDRMLVASHWVGMAKRPSDVGMADDGNHQHRCGRLYRGVERFVDCIWTYWDDRADPDDVDKQTTELLTGVASG